MGKTESVPVEVVYQTLSVAMLYTWWKTYELFVHDYMRGCLLIPTLVGLIWTVSVFFSSKEKKFTYPLRIATVLITVGVLSFLLALITIYDSSTHFLRLYYLSFASEFSIGWNIFTAVVCVAIGLFLLFPPQMGAIWGDKNRENTGALSIMTTPPTPFGLERQPSQSGKKNGDIVDQMIENIMNADTNLNALMQTDPGLAGKIQNTFDFYNPKAGVFDSWSRRLRGEGRVKLLEVLNQEQQLLIEQAAKFETQVREGKKSEVEYYKFMAQNALELMELKTKAKLNAKAFDKEMLPEDWSRVRTEQELLDIRLKEDEARSKRKLEEEEAQHLREQKAEEERIRRNLESARAFKMNEDAITDDLRTKMAKALIEIDQIEARTDISDKTKAALKIAKENEAENLRRRIAARERKAATDEESFL